MTVSLEFGKDVFFFVGAWRNAKKNTFSSLGFHEDSNELHPGKPNVSDWHIIERHGKLLGEIVLQNHFHSTKKPCKSKARKGSTSIN